MKDKEIKKELDKQLNREIDLPESLSAENIEKLIYEKGEVENPVRFKKHHGKIIAKVVASVAAVIVMIVGAVLIYDNAKDGINLKKLESAVENASFDDDYGVIELTVLSHYKDIYSNYIENSSNGILAYFGFGRANSSDSEVLIADESANAASSETSSSSYSTTNVQVSGVDEGDIVKNDGEYLYYVSDNKIIITHAETLTITSEIEIDNSSINEIFLYDDMLIAVTNDATDDEYYEDDGITDSTGVMFSSCYDYNGATTVRIYDITDKENPAECYSLKISGSYISSRITDGKLIVVADYTVPYDILVYDDIDDAIETVTELSVPVYSENDADNERISVDNIHFPDEDAVDEYIVIGMINLTDLSEGVYMSASFGAGYTVYCTNEHLYVTRCFYESSGTTREEYDDSTDAVTVYSVSSAEKTAIYKFDITDEGVTYTSVGEVSGSLLNSYSMDEYNGYLRIASNAVYYDSESSESRVENIVSVLDDDMNTIGVLSGIAPDETIQSARFMGDTLYLVTYYQTDPLFVIDLSDPTNPVIAGELEIPGFSAYLHPVSDTLIVGIGSGGTDEGLDNSAKISLFDVSDPSNPVEIDNYIVSDASINTDSRAFMVIDENTFAIPVIKMVYAEDSYCEYTCILVLNADENDLTLQGKYDTYIDDYNYNNYSVTRSAYIDDTLFVLSEEGIVAYDMTTQQETGRVEFP